jgi:hypothetical protein
MVTKHDRITTKRQYQYKQERQQKQARQACEQARAQNKQEWVVGRGMAGGFKKGCNGFCF